MAKRDTCSCGDDVSMHGGERHDGACERAWCRCASFTRAAADDQGDLFGAVGILKSKKVKGPPRKRSSRPLYWQDADEPLHWRHYSMADGGAGIARLGMRRLKDGETVRPCAGCGLGSSWTAEDGQRWHPECRWPTVGAFRKALEALGDNR